MVQKMEKKIVEIIEKKLTLEKPPVIKIEK